MTVTSGSGEVTYERTRYRCRKCGEWQTPADSVVCCGPQRVTKHIAKKVCQLAVTEHFTRLEQLGRLGRLILDRYWQHFRSSHPLPVSENALGEQSRDLRTRVISNTCHQRLLREN